MVQIIPAVLATNEEQYQKDISKLTASESLEGSWVHIDFADNKFVQQWE
jgi:pentose-5-phosphate-3-epimerase